MAGWFAGRRGWVWSVRRTAVRGVLTAVIGAAVLCAVGGGVFTAAAEAYSIGPGGGYDHDDGVGIQPFWFLPASDHVTFSDLGGHCDREKVFPSESVGKQIETRFDGFYLYSAVADGECRWEASNAQFRVDVTEPSGRTLWSDINVTETSWSSREYRVACYGDYATLPCKGDETRFQYSHWGPGVWFGDPGGPGGYTWCAVEGYGCDLPTEATISVAYGADGRFSYRTDYTGRSGIISCSDFRDPAPGFLKSCFYRVLGSRRRKPA
jgi:hypothetical protein